MQLPFPLHAMEPWAMGDEMFYNCKLGVIQYVFIIPFLAVATFIWYNPLALLYHLLRLVLRARYSRVYRTLSFCLALVLPRAVLARVRRGTGMCTGRK